MKKNILILALGSLGFIGSLSAMNLDDLYSRLVADAKHENRLPEMVECVKKQKGVLTHVASGSTIFMQIVALYNGVKAETKREEEKVGRCKASLAFHRQHLKYLEQEDHPDMWHIVLLREEISRTQQQLGIDVDKVTSLRQQGVALQEVFRVFLALGKGDTASENYFTVLMAELEKKKGGKPFITALRDTFPDKFPEPVEPESKEGEDKEDDETFTYTPPIKPDHKVTAARAFSFQRHVAKLNSSYNHFYASDISGDDYREKDLCGATIIRKVAESWYLYSPKTEDDRAGRTTFTSGGLFGTTTWTHYSEYHNYRSEHLAREFKKCLAKARGYDDYHDLMDCFLDNEVGYQTLIKDFEDEFPGEFANHKKLRETHPYPARVPASKEKISAYCFADLFCALFDGDDELSNAFEMVKERPTLVNACDPDGMPLLHQVLRMYNATPDDYPRKKMFGLFFNYLLVNGADYTKKYSMKKNAYMAPVERSVEEILDDCTKDYQTERTFDPYGQYDYTRDNKLNNPITQDTALFFKKKLDAFKADNRAPFEGSEGEWLEEMMPIAPKPKAGKDEPKKDEKPEEVNFEELLRNYQKNDLKTFWQNWKSSIKYFVSGMVVAGIGYWLKTRSWGDHHEEARIQRDLLRAANAQAS